MRIEAARRWRHGGRINGRWQEGQRIEAAGSWRERRRGGRSKQEGERQEGRESSGGVAWCVEWWSVVAVNSGLRLWIVRQVWCVAVGCGVSGLQVSGVA